MKYFFVIVIALIQTSLNAQDNIPPKLHGNLILNNGKEIQTGKIGFISKNELYFNLAQNDSLHWIYSISLDSVKHYEFDHKIRQYAFEESQKNKDISTIVPKIRLLHYWNWCWYWGVGSKYTNYDYTIDYHCHGILDSDYRSWCLSDLPCNATDIRLL